MKSIALHLKIENQPVMVLERESSSLELIQELLNQGARVTLATQSLSPGLEALVQEGKLERTRYDHRLAEGGEYLLVLHLCKETKEAGELFFWALKERFLLASLAGEEYSNVDLTGFLALLGKPHTTPAVQPGEVCLVGAGPGNAELITLLGLQKIMQADVIVYDRLIGQELLDYCPPGTERVYVGKASSHHIKPQDEINQILVDLAKQGKRVVRLKGGDPFIFGRGGEELETLIQEGIPFQVVPGVTAAAACGCFAGIPLTHRDYAQSCVFVTGHLKNDKLDFNWQALAQPHQTVVIYMGVANSEPIRQGLLDQGVSPDLPVAVVYRGGTERQQVVVATVGTMPQAIEKAGLKPPSLLIIGEVVKLQEKLNWFKPNPA